MKPHFEYSKLITVLVYSSAMLFSILTVIVALMGGDASAVANVALAYVGILGTTLGGYLWKAQAENKIKITLSAMKQSQDITGVAMTPAEVKEITQ